MKEAQNQLGTQAGSTRSAPSSTTAPTSAEPDSVLLKAVAALVQESLVEA